VVLMDCHMPVMDGFEATAELRRREAGGRRTPIIAMTAGVLPEDRQRCLDAGMDDFVAKPVAVEVLDAVLTRWEDGADSPLSSLSAPAAGAVTSPAGVPEGDALDRERLEFFRQLGPEDGWGLLPAVVGAFLQEAPARLSALHDAVTGGGGQPLVDAAHTLKGSAANVGATAVAELCRQLEVTSGSDSLGTAELVDQVETELDRAGLVLAAALPVPP
jgi:CheY-like chemotaxis protein